MAGERQKVKEGGVLSLGAANLTIGNASTPTPTPTLTPTPLPAPVVTGQVLASKPVTIRLYNADGTFNLTAPAGTYTIAAAADGFLNAQGSVTLIVGNVHAMSIVSLSAGDIDGNSVID